MIHDHISNPQELANSGRAWVLRMTSKAGASHVGSCLSVIDILSVLYSRVAKISPTNFNDEDRDIVILSKGHAAAALYAILGLQSFFPIEWLNKYCEDGQPLGGHVTRKGVPGVELSTGSLGHGLPYGVGIAIARKRQNINARVFVVMSDGECDEGTTWESALLANHQNLDNLCVIIDRNRLQSLRDTEETLKLEPFASKWEAFGWDVREVNGHNYDEIYAACKQSQKPIMVIARTIKGRGVTFMENSVAWHYKSLNDAELQDALSQLETQS